MRDPFVVIPVATGATFALFALVFGDGPGGAPTQWYALYFAVSVALAAIRLVVGHLVESDPLGSGWCASGVRRAMADSRRSRFCVAGERGTRPIWRTPPAPATSTGSTPPVDHLAR
jgi:hypothetical protein